MNEPYPDNKTTVEKLKELDEANPQNQENTMFKVMENYKKGVEYYNSYGLKEDGHHHGAGKPHGKNYTGSGTFWDLN